MRSKRPVLEGIENPSVENGIGHESISLDRLKHKKNDKSVVASSPLRHMAIDVYYASHHWINSTMAGMSMICGGGKETSVQHPPKSHRRDNAILLHIQESKKAQDRTTMAQEVPKTHLDTVVWQLAFLGSR